MSRKLGLEEIKRLYGNKEGIGDGNAVVMIAAYPSLAGGLVMVVCRIA